MSVFTVDLRDPIQREDYSGTLGNPDPIVKASLYGFGGSRLDVTSPRLLPVTPIDWQTKQPKGEARLDLSFTLTITPPPMMNRQRGASQSIEVALWGQDPEDLLANLTDLGLQVQEMASVIQGWISGQAEDPS